MSSSRICWPERARVTFACLLVALIPVPALAAEPAAYAGSKVCASCHADKARQQSASAHAAALYPVAQHPLSGSFPSGQKATRGREFRFDFAFSAQSSRIRISDSANVMDLPVEWAFGAGRQAVTFVTRVNKEWYVEHYASYYPALRSYAATPGQSAITPKSLAEAAGVIFKIADPDTGIAGCFQCHSTGPVSFLADGEVRLTEAGVRCEACHEGGSRHAADPLKNRVTNPGRLAAQPLNDFCGRCHRPPAAAGVNIDWNYAWNVRHQPVYLNESRCFRQSRGKLSCRTCHDPHEAAGQKRAAHYNRQCASCHTTSLRPPAAVCARGNANCVDCHMPLVSPQSPLRFTNHWIGIYGEGAKLKPRR